MSEFLNRLASKGTVLKRGGKFYPVSREPDFNADIIRGQGWQITVTDSERVLSFLVGTLVESEKHIHLTDADFTKLKEGSLSVEALIKSYHN